MNDNANPDNDQTFQKLLADCLESLERGAPIDRDRLRRDHPGHADSICEFLDNNDVVVDAIVGLRGGDEKPVVDTAFAPTMDSHSQNHSKKFEIGDSLRYVGEYEIVDEIARGGMGIVFRARQSKLRRDVALKMILSGRLASEADVDRFHREARAAASLKHPNIVGVHEVGQHEGHHYFTMDFVDGESLAHRISEGSLAPRRAAELIKTVAEAISYAHERGVLHRDLKPANILIDASGQPHVTDFGLAKTLVDDATNVDLTATGQIIGTPSYMAPEQASAKHQLVCVASDVYSVGAILYACLSGRAPFIADSTVDTIRQVIEKEPVSLRLLNPQVPRDLETICLKCLSKDIKKRYASANDLGEELERYLNGKPIQARPVGQVERAWRWCRRKPFVSSLIGAVAASLLIGTCVSTYFAILANNRAHVANHERARADEKAAELATQEAKARQRAYISDINLVQRVLRQSNVGRARRILHSHVPETSQEDLRDWEWRYLWQLCQSQAEQMVANIGESIWRLDASSDGRWVASAHIRNGQTTLSLIDLETQVPQQEPVVSRAMAFSPSAPILAVAKRPREVELRDLERNIIAETLKLDDFASLMKFSGDGRYFVVLDGSRLRRFRTSDWSLTDASPSMGIRHGGEGNPFAVSEDGELVAFSRGKSIDVFDWQTKSVLWSQPHSEVRLTAVAFSPDGTQLASGTGYANADIDLWNVKTGELISKLSGHYSWISGLQFTPQGDSLISSCADQTIRLWDLSDPESPQSRVTLVGHGSEVWGIAMASSARKLFSGGKAGEILSWNLDDVDTSVWPKSVDREIVTWSFASMGKTIVTVDKTGHVEEWSLPELSPIRSITTLRRANLRRRGPGYLAGPTFSEDGRLLAVPTFDGGVSVWDVAEGKVKCQLATPSDAAIALFCEPNKLLVRHGDGSLHRWNHDNGEDEPIDFSVRVNRGVWKSSSSDDALYLFSYDGGMGEAWNQTSRTVEPFGLDVDRFVDIAFTSDTRLAVSVSQSTGATLWDFGSRKKIGDFSEHLNGVHSVAFSPNDNRLASAGGGMESVKIWDVNTQRELLNFETVGRLLSHTRFSPDGNSLTSLSGSGQLYVWHAPAWDKLWVDSQSD